MYGQHLIVLDTVFAKVLLAKQCVAIQYICRLLHQNLEGNYIKLINNLIKINYYLNMVKS